MNWIILLLVFIAGAATSIQAGVNGTLGKKVGALEAAFISFLVGTIFLSILLAFLRKGNIMSALETPRWQLTGGLLGAVYILIMVTAVPRIGIAAALVTLIAGQLITGTLIDHFGFIGDKQIPIDWKRVTAIILLGCSIYLFHKK
ncbi:membrane protein [Sporocytophaga myxococcoides]|uniref:Membrane protein n=1 Tax=Sporocytophaga myxococcoides TaxID=153721 RepID=A0A098LGC1_9BACT|nr:DMT family transporter [Sporocytophaga myxococcoides]GAL85487.1 membrane protein [Sporocytophaga myxococcoides]